MKGTHRMSSSVIAGIMAGLAAQGRRFFAGFHLVDRKRREFNPGRFKRGQGAKFSGEAIRALNAQRGVGSVRRVDPAVRAGWR